MMKMAFLPCDRCSAKRGAPFAIIAFFGFLLPILHASQIEPLFRLFYQPDGTAFRGRMVGDEYVAFCETENGYTIEQDSQGYWCYAEIGSQGKLQASKYRVDAAVVDPPANVSKHLRHSQEVMAEIQQRRLDFYDRLKPWPIKRRTRSKGGVGAGISPVTYNLAVLLIEFPNVPSTYAVSNFEQLLFSEGFSFVSPAPGEESFGSLRDYYQTVSDGNLIVTGQVFDWVVADHEKSFYENSGSLVDEAIAKSAVNTETFDGFAVIYAASVGSANGKLWPRATANGRTFQYIMSEKWLPTYDFSPIGVHCHEFGHLLGLPDLYDTDFSSPGIGLWGLMGNGNFGNGHHERPFHMSAWSKAYLGWVSPTMVYESQDRTFTLTPVEVSSQVLKLISMESYFLLENRQSIGYDLNLPGSGLLIWHIDERFGQQTLDMHPLVGLERADGDQSNGDAGDPFPGASFNTRFDAMSVPSSQDYDGVSRIGVADIRVAGENMQFEVSVDLGAGAGITLNHEGNFPTLFTALESAGEGDSVHVGKGTYFASNLFVKTRRTLLGGDPSQTILDGEGATILKLVDALDATISGFSFTNAATAISLVDSRALITRNILRDFQGTAITCSRSSPEIRNNTIVNGNSAAIGCFSGSSPVIENNVIIYNGIGISSSGSSFPELGFNDLWNNGVDYAGLSSGPNDISADPLLVNLLYNDYHLRTGSPCIDRGNPASDFNDPDGTRNDIGALPFDFQYVAAIEGIRVNAGGENFQGDDSTFWARDQSYDEGGWGFVGGQDWRTFDPIDNTTDDPLYQNERRGLDSYLFDLPNGRYRVGLHFCEISWNETNRRVFDVAIEGRNVLQGLDIFAQVGHDFATQFSFFTDVRDHQLDIDFSASIGLPQVSAIDVDFAQPFLIDIAELAKVAHPALTQGIAIGDYNNDTLPDLFLANAGRANLLFRNNGFGLFTNVTAESEFLLVGGGRMGVWADYDNDGDLDLYVVRTNISNLLYANNGDGTFSDVAALAGVADAGDGVTCAWADYDNDGHLDLFLANHGSDILYRNQGDGTFLNSTAVLGTKSSDASTDAVWGDLNSDGYLDLLVTHDVGSAPVSNILYVNNQDGSFRMTELSENGVGANLTDYDNDGDLDVFMIVRILPQGITVPRLLRNEGSETFQDVTEEVGMLANDATLSGGWLDLENDGLLDLLILKAESPDVLFHNNGDGTFTDISTVAGLEDRDSERTLAFADFDADGDQDIYVGRFGKNNVLYQNQTTGNNWLGVRLIGTGSNRTGVGANVQLVTGSLLQLREINAGSGFASQSDPVATFGLGKVALVDTLQVRWPSGQVDILTNIADINRVVDLVEGSVVPSVDLVFFSARAERVSVVLEWQAANPHSFLGFEIERGRDRVHFQKIAQVEFSQDGSYEWVDSGLDLGRYYYRLKLLDENGTSDYSDIIEAIVAPPTEFTLSQNFPNPFNQGTTISYSLPRGAHLTIKIYDLLGKEVRTLVDAPHEKGYHTITWDGNDHVGRSAASGIYYYVLTSEDFAEMKKLVFVK